MQIRVGDRKIVAFLALVGAVSGAALSLLWVFTEYSTAKNELAEERQYVQEHMPLLSLDDSVIKTENKEAPGKAIDESKAELARRAKRLSELEEGFWVNLSIWQLLGLGAGTLIVGLVGGYFIAWLFWLLVMFLMYMAIRGVYKRNRLKQEISQLTEKLDIDDEDKISRRDDTRVLPQVIKWTVVILGMAVLLGLLAMQGCIRLGQVYG